MEWLIVLVLVLAVPPWIIMYWIPRCDAAGIEVAHQRIASRAAS